MIAEQIQDFDQLCLNINFVEFENWKILLKKLEMYGITSTELKWFSIYLRGRKQVVRYHQETSEFCDITCGIQQGSVLGPILF